MDEQEAIRSVYQNKHIIAEETRKLYGYAYNLKSVGLQGVGDAIEAATGNIVDAVNEMDDSYWELVMKELEETNLELGMTLISVLREVAAQGKVNQCADQ